MMAENTGAAETQADSTTQPQAGDSPATQQSQADGATDESKAVDAAVLQRELAEARKEAARYRTEAKKLADAQKAAEEASLPEKERQDRRITELERERADLERQVKEMRLHSSVIGIASRLGFADPGDAMRLLDASSLEVAEDGQPQGVEKALKDLLAAKPYLAAAAARPTGSADAGNGGSAAATDMNELLRAARRGPN